MHVRVSAERTIHLPVADEDTLLCMVKISPSVSTKRMTWATQQTSHSVVVLLVPCPLAHWEQAASLGNWTK